MEQNFNSQELGWKDTLAHYLGAVEHDAMTKEQAILSVGRLCVCAVRTRAVPNVGAFQTYLRERDACVQLVAQKFVPLERLDFDCVDIVTGEPRKHTFAICVGSDSVRQAFSVTKLSNEVNEYTLRQSTGILTWKNH